MGLLVSYNGRMVFKKKPIRVIDPEVSWEDKQGQLSAKLAEMNRSRKPLTALSGQRHLPEIIQMHRLRELHVVFCTENVKISLLPLT